MTEKWKPIQGTDDIYWVSNRGRIKSIDRMVHHNTSTSGLQFRQGQIIKTTIGSIGYPVFNMLGKQYYVHRIVATHFIENPDKKQYVNHKDGDKSNNITYNLEWVTSSENLKHSYRMGLHSSKITEKQRREIINRRASGETYQTIADDYGVSKQRIFQIVNERKGK